MHVYQTTNETVSAKSCWTGSLLCGGSACYIASHPEQFIYMKLGTLTFCSKPLFGVWKFDLQFFTALFLAIAPMGDDSDGPSQPNRSFSPEYIMEFQWKRKARFYKIKWKDAAEPDFTWEDAEDIEPLYPSLVENFWAQIDTRRGLSPNSSASEPSVAPSTDDSSSEYDSAKDEDFKAPTDSPSEDESFSADWKTVRSVEGMDKTLDGHVRVYIRW
ncbi:hypothetical protein INT44_008222 [Umbelopsis vinacea]|uniref:Chromo domain-containing protein n=1 Tax=Umbelopsis vinacea TaxID=44442 RepID=A0A8H7PPD6_9FUNG|nr:hypothetical protein INT44_008222 [Umbelopsis vinacea]